MIGPLLKTEIENTFTVIREKSSSEELVFLCPECGDKSGHRSLNLRTGLTFCFRCNKGKNNKGNFIAWAKALGHRFTHGNSVSGISLETMLTQRDEKSIVPVVKPTDLPKGFTPLERDPKNVYAKLIGKMARRKNLHLDDFIEAGAGYTEVMPWEPFCIFPVVEYGMTVYYQGRTYVDVPGETTKKFPSRRQVEFGASYWVYNIDEVRAVKPPTIVIVESILNVLSLRNKFREMGVEREFVPVCVFKHYISQVQLIKLFRIKDVKEFCLLFDHDAIDKTWDMVGQISNKVRVSIAEMPMVDGNKKMDANDDVDLAWKSIKTRKPYTANAVLGHLFTSNAGDARSKNVFLTGMRIGSKRP